MIRFKGGSLKQNCGGTHLEYCEWNITFVSDVCVTSHTVISIHIFECFFITKIFNEGKVTVFHIGEKSPAYYHYFSL